MAFCGEEEWSVEVLQVEASSKFLWWEFGEAWLWRAYPPGTTPADAYKDNNYLVGTSSSREEAIKDAEVFIKIYETDEQRRTRTREVVCISL